MARVAGGNRTVLAAGPTDEVFTEKNLTLAFGGVLMFLSDKLLGGQWRAGGGDVVLLVASSLFSYYTVAAKPIMERHGPVLTMGYATLWGGMPLLAVSIPLGWDSPWDQLQFWDWFGVVWAVEVSAFFGWLAWGWINQVRGVARDTWRYFERCIGPQDHHLPPDNLQTLPQDALAHRTSPTNIGLYLLSVATARDFGWIGAEEMVAAIVPFKRDVYRQVVDAFRAHLA